VQEGLCQAWTVHLCLQPREQAKHLLVILLLSHFSNCMQLFLIFSNCYSRVELKASLRSGVIRRQSVKNLCLAGRMEATERKIM